MFVSETVIAGIGLIFVGAFSSLMMHVTGVFPRGMLREAVHRDEDAQGYRRHQVYNLLIVLTGAVMILIGIALPRAGA